MVVINACVQKKVLLFILFLTVLVTLVYVHSTTNMKHIYFDVVTENPEPCILPRSQPNNTVLTNTNFSLIVAIQVHNRLSYLKELISSLSSSMDINKALLIFSHDYYDEDINTVIQNITFCKYIQLFYPYAIEAMPNHTNPATNTIKVSQVKLHWWWKANEAFRIAAHYKYDGLVLFLEEDQFVVEDFIHVLKILQTISNNYCQNCVYSLSDDSKSFKNNKFRTSKKMSNMGLAFNATTWSTISACAKVFCKYDDYNWDWTLNYIFQECVRPQTKTLIMSGSRVVHIGKCGMHFNNKDCDATKLVEEIKNEICESSTWLYPKMLEYVGEKGASQIVKNFGGFKEKEVQQLCLDFSSCDLITET